MHIVFICAEFPLGGRSTGGFGTYVDTITLGLVSQGVEVTIICSGNRDAETWDGSRRIISVCSEFSVLQFTKKSPLLKRLITFFEYPFVFSFRVTLEVFRLHKKHRVSLVEGGDFGGETFFTVLIRKLRIITSQIVIKLHTPSFVLRQFNDEQRTLFYLLMETIEKWCLKNAQAIYSPTQALSFLVGNKYKLHATQIIPYPATSKSNKMKIKKNDNMVLHVGKLQPKKGVFDLLCAAPEVLKTYPKTVFVFIGPDTLHDGQSTKTRLMQESKKRGIDYAIQFIDQLPQEKLGFYYQKATLLVVPSHWDNFPNVILEAGTRKLPVIATNVGGISEMLVHKKTALLVSVRSPQEITTAIQLLFKDQNLRKKLGENLSRDLKLKYGTAKIAKLTILFYANVLKSTTKE